jgi:hypothetical protein
MDTAGVRKHIKNQSHQKAEENQSRFVAIDWIKQNEQDVRIRIDISHQVYFVENGYLSQNQQKKSYDI